MYISPPKFHINIKVNPKYATTRNVNHNLVRDVEEARRLQLEGKKHIDLWVDGSIYPRDPSNGRLFAFSYVHNLIRFVGDGANGLLGYCSWLSQFDNEHRNHLLYLNTLLISSQNQAI